MEPSPISAAAIEFVSRVRLFAPRIAAAGWMLPFTVFVAVAAVIRSIAWSRTGVMFNDGPIFIELAQLIRIGEWEAALAHPFHPLYPIAIAGAHALISDWEVAAAFVSIVAGSLATGVWFLFLNDAFDSKVAAVGALLFAFHPYAVAYASDVQSEGLYALFFVAAIAVLWRSYRMLSPGCAVWAGVLAGLAYMVRPEGLGIVVVGGGLAGLLITLRRWPLRRGAVWFAALCAGAGFVAAPYVSVLHAHTDSWVLTQKKSASFQAVAALPVPLRDETIVRNPFLETVFHGTRESSAVPAPAEPEFEDASVFAAVELTKTMLAALRPEIAVLLLIGLTVGLRRRMSREGFVALLAVAYCAVLYALTLQSGYVSKRHALPVALLGFGYAAAGVPVLGAGLIRAWCWLSPRRLQIPLTFSTAVGVALTLAIALPSTLQPRRQERVAERLAAEWLGEQAGARGAVAAGKQRVAFYAGRPHVRLPDAATPDALAALRAAGARYLIVDDHYLDENAALRRAVESGMRALHRIESRGRTATVYAIDGNVAAGAGAGIERPS